MELGKNILSLFDGISCGQLALNKAGIRYDNYFASEIDKYAIKVTQANYPKTIQLGDVKKLDGCTLPKIDLLVGGSPCQGFSFAGKQLNFNDPRSKLFFEFVRLLKETKPKYFLLENVLMKKEYEQVITNQLGVEPILINSNLVSAQNRKRLYWTNIPNVSQPTDKSISWGDIREHGVNTESFYYTEKAMQWLARVSQKKNKVLTVHSDTDNMQMLEASHHKKYSNQRYFGIADLPTDNQLITSLREQQPIKYKGQHQFNRSEPYIYFDYNKETNVLNTLTTTNEIVPFTLPNKIPNTEFFFRYITPLECERLQTVPDNYTNFVSNTQRYKMLGNGWTVDVIAHILKQINN